MFFEQVIAALVLFQLMMVAILGIKQSFSGILVRIYHYILYIVLSDPIDPNNLRRRILEKLSYSGSIQLSVVRCRFSRIWHLLDLHAALLDMSCPIHYYHKMQTLECLPVLNVPTQQDLLVNPRSLNMFLVLISRCSFVSGLSSCVCWLSRGWWMYSFG
jgi:hypothetical protein